MDKEKTNYRDDLGMCTAALFTEEEECQHYDGQELFPYPGACAYRGMNGTCMSPKANNDQLPAPPVDSVGSGPRPLRSCPPPAGVPDRAEVDFVGRAPRARRMEASA